MRKVKLFGIAFAVATAAFVVIMVQNPPKSVASNPANGVTVSGLKVPMGLPSVTYDAY
jgi:hypothetical protein